MTMNTEITFKNLIDEHFKRCGIPRTVRFLAFRLEKTEQTIRNWIRSADHGVGTEPEYLHPINADLFINASVAVLKNKQGKNPVKRYLDKLKKEYDKRRMERFNG